MNRLRHLLARLHAPFASWGDVGLGNHRPTARHPTRSALLGLLGAALGIDREDRPAQARLAHSVSVCAEVRKHGTWLKDYHTVQTRPASDRRPYANRRGELDLPRDELITMLTEREYLTDVSYVLAVWARGQDATTLDSIAAALRAPAFPPYLGRRSCPLSAPFQARVDDHATLHDAFASVEWSPPLDGPRHAARETLAVGDEHPNPGYVKLQRFASWDEPVHHAQRGFSRRNAVAYGGGA